MPNRNELPRCVREQQASRAAILRVPLRVVVYHHHDPVEKILENYRREATLLDERIQQNRIFQAGKTTIVEFPVVKQPAIAPKPALAAAA